LVSGKNPQGVPSSLGSRRVEYREGEALDVAAERAEVRGQELREHVDPFLLHRFGLRV